MAQVEHLGLRVAYGALRPKPLVAMNCRLPKSWDGVIGLFAAGVLIVGLSAFGSFVLTKFSEAKGKPLLRIGIIAGAVALLGLAFREKRH